MKTDQTTNSVEADAKPSTPEARIHNAIGEGRVGTKARRSRRVRTIIFGLIIFTVALGVRFLSWHDTRRDVWKVQTVVAENYRRVARVLIEGGPGAFLNPASPLGDANTLGHPPGYAILMALLFGVFGESDALIQFVQIACDAFGAVVVFLIVSLLLRRSVGLIAGLLVAFSPQFAWNSVLLLPDTLAVLPILLAVYFLARAYSRPSLVKIIAAGALVGLSCWLRANAMLLAPFMALAIPFLFERGKRLRYAAALVGGALLVIAPLTVRNAIVFGHFIPVSLGAGQTLLEGIADYDAQGRFGIPDTDMGIMKWEAEMYGRPDYYGTLFNPDGVRRERLRLAHGLSVVRSHPFWFSGVMVRRGASMLRLERARLVSASPPVTHSLALVDELQPVWSNSPAEFLSGGALSSPQAKVGVAPDGATFLLAGDDSTYGVQFASAPVSVRKDTDYALVLPAKIEQGRAIINLAGANDNTIYATTIIETVEHKSPEEQPFNMIRMPFVSGSASQIRIVIANGASKPTPPLVRVGAIRLYELGPARNLWTRYPRIILRAVQKLYLTAIMLPLTVIGIILLARARRGRASLILLIVPAYYLCVQSAMHTEYRYVLAVHYFLFVMSALTLSWLGGALWQALMKGPFPRRLRD
ncbi:MAG TPA: glycosyltransferase family 39 protein [Pyrinomonadaceae bacterium]|jgi:hypothetical protein|nr:glycosyltransferase family 39 protein [Pyrinomonadaceae bacterium]